MRRSYFFLLATLVFLGDQWTKYWAVTSLPLDASRQLIPNILYFTRTTNTGAAFGVLPNATALLALTSLAAVVGITGYVLRTPNLLQPLFALGLALPLGGAFGNFVDRVRLGHVVDFIEVHIGSYVWPIFNVADSAICIGVAALTLLALTGPSATPGQTEKTHSLS